MNKIKAIINDIVHKLRTKEMVPIIVPTDKGELFCNKVALISGGSGGIGKAIAQELINEGGKVIIAGTNNKKIEKIIDELGESNLKGLQMDITNVASFEEKICMAESLFDNNSIDILINCAGVNDSRDFLHVTEEIYDKVLDINTKGTYFLSQVVAKHMISKNIKGHILNVSSSSALRPASTPYIISKEAISGMTKGMADVLIKYGIIVNAIAPGPVATSMVGKNDMSEIEHITCPIGRYAMPSEIAHLAGYMVSDYGNLIVGDTFYITGGSGTISLHK